MWTMLGSSTTSCKDGPAALSTSSCSVQTVFTSIVASILLCTVWISFTHFWCKACTYTYIRPHSMCIVLHSSLLQPGKLSPWALQGVPPNLIVAFPYRTRWHLVDFLSSIILSGKWLFPTSCVMVYRENEGLWWGQGLGNRIKHQWSNAGICRPDLFSFASLCLILFQMYFWMTCSNLSCVTSRDGSA